MKTAIRQWRQNYKAGKYDNNDVETMCEAGWHDWFCKDTSLKNKIKKFTLFINKITNDYILDNFYLYFKNNCPCCGPLYDTIGISPINEDENPEMHMGITIDSPYEDTRFALYTENNNYENVIETNNKKEIIDYINNIQK